MTDRIRPEPQQDEWAIPQANTPDTGLHVRVTAPPGLRPRIFHQYGGETFAIPFAMYAVADDRFTRYSRNEVVKALTYPDRITLIIAADDDKVDAVGQVLDQWGLAMLNNACMSTIPAAAEYIFRANELADSQIGMLLNMGGYLKRHLRPLARSACEAIFQQVDAVRRRERADLHLFPG